MNLMVDPVAKELALRYGVPECLHLPVAAADEAAISTFVGDIVWVLNGGQGRRAFLVEAWHPPMRDERYPIWGIAGSEILEQRTQIWVDVAYTRYRRAYLAGALGEEVGERIVSHTSNRRMVAVKGFRFVRLTLTSRAANSSSAFSENWGVALHSDPYQLAANRRRGALIQYADLTELMLMLDMKLGGGVMDSVNEGRKLIRPRPD